MCPVMIITIYFEADHKKMVSAKKKAFLDPKRATLGNQGHKTARQTATYQKTEGIQSYLRI